MKIVKPPFTKLVAGVIKSGDPSVGVNPTVDVQARQSQWIVTGGEDIPKSYPSAISGSTFNTNGMVQGANANATATIVFDAVHALGQDYIIIVGNYELTSGKATSITGPSDTIGDFYTGGNIAQLLDSVVTSLNGIPEITAAHDGVSTVTLTHSISLEANSDFIVISYQTLKKLTNQPITAITQFTGGSPTVSSEIVS